MTIFRALIGLMAAAALVVPVLSQTRSSVAAKPSAGKGLTAVAGLRVGQHTLSERPTGCTVVIMDGDGAVAGVAQRGAAPGTVETDLLNPANMIERINAIVLTGGSAYGIEVRQGVLRYLEEKKTGYKIAGTVVPIVPGAVLMDLAFGGNSSIRPGADCGYKAASSATDAAVVEGNVGAGAGATVGKTAGFGRSMKAGLGTSAIVLPNGLVVAALAAVNAVGDIVDPTTGTLVAGVRTEDGKRLADARAMMRSSGAPRTSPRAGENTTLAIVATNARLTKAEITRVALMADDGLARAVNPAHTTGDGDTVFAVATARWEGQAEISVVGSLAADALSEAIVRAATQATASGGLPSARDLGTVPSRLR